MRIAIVDDCEETLDKLQECVMECIGTEASEIRPFKNPLKLLEELGNNHEYHLYLLDIEMEQLSGLELAKKIRKIQRDAFIVFITSHSDFVLNSYDIQIKTYQYILKADVKEKLPEVLSEIQSDMEEIETQYYLIQNQRRIERIKFKEITNIRKEAKNAVFVTEAGEHYSERKTLNQVIKEINRPEFIFVDKGVIANIRQIRRIESSEIVFFNGTKVHISRANIQKVKYGVSEYWGMVL